MRQRSAAVLPLQAQQCISPLAAAGPVVVAPPAVAAAVVASPAVHPAALTAMANAGLVKELNERGDGKPLSADELARMKASTVLRAPQFLSTPGAGAAVGESKPELLSAPRGGKGDDLGLIWGVGDKLAEKLNGWASGTSIRSPNGRRPTSRGSKARWTASRAALIATSGSNSAKNSPAVGGPTATSANGRRGKR